MIDDDQKPLPLQERLTVIQNVFQSIRLSIPVSDQPYLDAIFERQLLLISAFRECNNFLQSQNNTSDDREVKLQILKEFHETAKDPSVNAIYPIYQDVKKTFKQILNNKTMDPDLRKKAYFMNRNLDSHPPEDNPQQEKLMNHLLHQLA